MTGTHEDDTAIPVQPGSKRARVSTDTSNATPEKKDLLTELFERMRPYCKPRTFVYNILMTIFRHVLIMNKVYEYGRNVWHGNPEGEDVLRFWIVYGTIVGTSAIDLLRGGAIAKRAKRFLPGVPEIFDGGLQNLPGVPGPRQVRYYSATPYPLKDVVRVSALMVDQALEVLGGPKGRVLGVTFDCVHGESRLEVVRDIDGEFVVLGPAYDEYRFTGEIVGMKWVDDTEPPQICAEIRSYDKKDTERYCVYDLPAMVIAAEDEQLLDVLLEYDPPEDEFDLLGDEEAERTMAQPLEPEDDDDAEDNDDDLEL